MKRACAPCGFRAALHNLSKGPVRDPQLDPVAFVQVAGHIMSRPCGTGPMSRGPPTIDIDRLMALLTFRQNVTSELGNFDRGHILGKEQTMMWAPPSRQPSAPFLSPPRPPTTLASTNPPAFRSNCQLQPRIQPVVSDAFAPPSRELGQAQRALTPGYSPCRCGSPVRVSVRVRSGGGGGEEQSRNARTRL
jgi:hypothetical protein